jgi:uncharacterized membrane protein YdbT with pleckstrin-like domain
MENEKTLFEGRPKLRAYSGMIWSMAIFTLGTFGLGLILTLPMAIWILFEVKGTHYNFTSARIQIEKGIFSTTINTMELWRVRDLRYQRSLLEKLTDGCTLVLVTQDLLTPNLVLKGFTATEGREMFEKLQGAIAEARKRNNTMAVTG